MAESLLAIDISNSIVRIGVFRGPQVAHQWRLSADAGRTTDEYAVLVDSLFARSGVSAAGACVMASVVPRLQATFVRLCQDHLGVDALVVGPGVRTGLSIQTDSPREVGPDRIANGVAARSMYGVPAVVIDFGTALSFDAISADGAYIGTAIAPGLQMAANALSARTARLQDVTLISPPHAIGRNTEASMQSGLVFGYAGLVEGMVGRFQRALGGAARIVSTGDDAELILRHTTVPHHFDPDLTLHGLRLIHEQNA